MAQFGKPPKVAPKGMALSVRRGGRKPSKVSLPVGEIPAEILGPPPLFRVSWKFPASLFFFFCYLL